MFGYINPDRPNMFVKDEILYKALYCGMCKSIKRGCGQMARTALTYDMAFMSALMHNIMNTDVKIKKSRCGLHMIKGRPMAVPDDTSILLGCINTVLTYYKLLDDKQDGEKKGLFAFLYKGGYKKTLKKHPQVAEIIRAQVTEQSKLEKDGCSIIDQACEPTAMMMKDLSRYILGEYATEYTDMLCYDIGKWVYLADALDDYDKDVRKGRFNVLYNVYKVPTKAEAVSNGQKEMTFIFDSLFADMRFNLSKIVFHFNHDLTDNIIIMGIPRKTRQLFFCNCGEGKKEENNE